MPVSPPDKSKKIRTWGPSSVHQRDREKSRRVKAKDRFMTERCNSVPNLGTQVNQTTGKKVLCYLHLWCCYTRQCFVQFVSQFCCAFAKRCLV